MNVNNHYESKSWEVIYLKINMRRELVSQSWYHTHVGVFDW
jgi:hypothetical protein